MYYDSPDHYLPDWAPIPGWRITAVMMVETDSEADETVETRQGLVWRAIRSERIRLGSTPAEYYLILRHQGDEYETFRYITPHRGGQDVREWLCRQLGCRDNSLIIVQLESAIAEHFQVPNLFYVTYLPNVVEILTGGAYKILRPCEGPVSQRRLASCSLRDDPQAVTSLTDDLPVKPLEDDGPSNMLESSGYPMKMEDAVSSCVRCCSKRDWESVGDACDARGCEDPMLC